MTSVETGIGIIPISFVVCDETSSCEFTGIGIHYVDGLELGIDDDDDDDKYVVRTGWLRNTNIYTAL